MKKLWLLLLCVLLPLAIDSLIALPSVAPVAVIASEPAPPPVEEREPSAHPSVYMPSEELSLEETVYAYFEQQYLAYANLSYIDISGMVDVEQSQNRNALVWLQTLIQRRRLLSENNLCYVETRQFPYDITFLAEDELADDRTAFWRNRNLADDNEHMLHFVITGEPGRAYPPMMAVNAQQTMRFREVDGIWKMTLHYYPGSVRRYRRDAVLQLPAEESMLADLRKEFANTTCDPSPLPSNAKPYTGAAAARYAKKYTETPNPGFYNIGDWMGNCANFISQCIWYGFGSGEEMPNMYARENMTASWYAGSGGGSPAWENVDYFWQYAVGGQGLYGHILEGVSALEQGDIVQTRSGGNNSGDEDDFNHSLLVVDKETLLLAQNSPGCFVYYSDIVNVEARFFRPAYLKY